MGTMRLDSEDGKVCYTCEHGKVNHLCPIPILHLLTAKGRRWVVKHLSLEDLYLDYARMMELV